MKIDKATSTPIADAVRLLDTPERRDRYRNGNFPNAAGVKNLDVRYRWDLWYGIQGWRYVKDIPGIKDTHIDTVLRRCVPPL